MVTPSKYMLMNRYQYPFIIALILLVASAARGQQQFLITQYMFNGLALNPAYAGVHDGLSISALSRHQWVGMDGAPNTQFISAHSPISYRPIALGAVIYRDVIGITKEHSATFSYAYRIKIADKTRLSFGIQASVRQLSQNFGYSAADDPNDPLLSVDNSLKFNTGTGLLLHSDRFYVGVSVPQLLRNKFGSRQLNSDSHLERHYYATAGYVFQLTPQLMVKPNVLFKAVGGAPAQVDLNLNALIAEVLWLGVSNRSKSSYSALVGFQISPQMQFGYALDFANKSMGSTSHEFMLNYVISMPGNKILTPRYF